jgi:2'-hydroxyisoflavone reductase
MATSRRSFLKSSAVAAAAVGIGRAGAVSAMTEDGATSGGGKGPTLLMVGGTGFFGPAVVKEAMARGFRVTLFNRGKTNPHLFPELEKLKGDREQGIEALEAEVAKGRSWDYVIDTSGYVPSHVEAIATLLAPKATQYVFFSTVGVYADHGVPADEQSAVAQATDEFLASVKTIREALANYGALKALCEQAAEAAMPGRVTNIRPGLIVGPMDRSDRFTYWAVRVERGGEVLAPGDGTDPVQLVDVRDLATWTMDCIERKITGVFNAISPAGRFNMAEMLYGIKASFTTDARFTWVPADFLEAQEVQAWTHMPVWLPAVGETAGFHMVSTEKAVAAGLKFRPLADTARDTVAWHKAERPADYDFDRGAGITREREAELLRAWHEREASPEPEAAETEAETEGEG